MTARRMIVGLVILAAAGAFFACRTEPPRAAAAPGPAVSPGIDVLLAKHLDLIRGKRVGLITNPSGVGRSLRSTIDLLREAPEVKLIALYGPEHGVRGNAQAGEFVPYFMDEKLGLPVFSLYGPSMKPAAGMFKNIDEYMRSFDTTHEDKKVAPDMTKGLDVLVFDIQDVGTRVYTYEATMAYAMQAAAEAGIEYIVLDRPNPIGGTILEGPILEYPEFSSFVGLYAVPLRFGLTIGELARMYNDLFQEKKAKLTVIPAEGWKREMWFDETGLPWVVPSPNIPTLEAAVVYPGQVFFEGTNVSEGRGTTKPFEYFGAPWIDGVRSDEEAQRPGPPGRRLQRTVVHPHLLQIHRPELRGLPDPCHRPERLPAAGDDPPHHQNPPRRIPRSIRVPRQVFRQDHGDELGPDRP